MLALSLFSAHDQTRLVFSSQNLSKLKVNASTDSLQPRSNVDIDLSSRQLGSWAHTLPCLLARLLTVVFTFSPFTYHLKSPSNTLQLDTLGHNKQSLCLDVDLALQILQGACHPSLSVPVLVLWVVNLRPDNPPFA